MKTKLIHQVIEAYEKTGRTAHLYPRLKRISLNGGKRLPIEQAVQAMLSVVSFLQRKDS